MGVLGMWGSGVTVDDRVLSKLSWGEEYGSVGLERCVGLVGDHGGH